MANAPKTNLDRAGAVHLVAYDNFLYQLSVSIEMMGVGSHVAQQANYWGIDPMA